MFWPHVAHRGVYYIKKNGNGVWKSGTIISDRSIRVASFFEDLDVRRGGGMRGWEDLFGGYGDSEGGGEGKGKRAIYSYVVSCKRHVPKGDEITTQPERNLDVRVLTHRARASHSPCPPALPF